jgi:hypothetical protein
MTFSTAPALSRRFFITLLLGLALTLGFTGRGLYFQTALLEEGDTAANALQIENAKRFRELYGNYSRFEFNHPGPAFFYTYAAGEELFHHLLGVTKSPGAAHLLVCMLTQVFFFALALAIICAHTGWRLVLPFALALAAWHFGRQGQAFMSIWPPHVLTMPFLTFLAATISVGAGNLAHLWALVLAGGFLFHGHVAQPLFVGGLGSLALGLAMWRAGGPAFWRQLRKPHRRQLWFAVTATVLFMLPLAVDVATLGAKSNVATILGRFTANTSDSKGLVQSALYFFSFATDATNQGDLFSQLGPATSEFFREHAWPLAVGALVLTLPLAAAWRWRRAPAEPGAFFRAAGLIYTTTIGLCILWGIAQAGPMENFNGFFYHGVFFFAAVLGWAALTTHWQPRVPAALAVVLCLASAPLFARNFFQGQRTGDEAQATMQKGVRAALAADPNARPKLLVFEHTNWPKAVGVALALDRSGPGVFVTSWWEFMFGRRLDASLLPQNPEDLTAVWWIAAPAAGGFPVTADAAIFLEPPSIGSGDTISLAGGANGFRHAVTGLTVGNIEFACTNERRVVFLLTPQPAAADMRIVFDAHSHTRAKDGTMQAQTGEVFFNGEYLGHVTVAERSEISVQVPAALWNREARAKLEIVFSAAVPRTATKRPRYTAWHAWGLWKIRFEAAQ